ncbi:MAG: hypothetical protein AAFZ63_26310 [Bacteroidota bacterium]
MTRFCLFVSLLIVGSLQAQQTLNNPIGYFDFFNQQHNVLAQKNMEYLQYAVHSDDIRVIAEKRLALLEQVQSTQEQVNQVPQFDNDAGLKATMTEVLSTYEELFDIGFQQVENLKVESQESFAQMERYLAAQTAAEKRMAEASARLLAAQKRFAQANRISLMEDGESTTQAEQLNALNEYQRDIFLRSFRLGKMNANFMVTMEKGDGEELENIRQAMVKAANEELPVLKVKPDFKGDAAYRDANVEQLEIIKNLAENDYPAIVNAVKKGGQLTQADVNAYNQAISKVNTLLNPIAEKVNIALQNLLRTNVPKPALRGVKQI